MSQPLLKATKKNILTFTHSTTIRNTNIFTDMMRFLGSFLSHFMKRAFFSVA